MLVSFLNTFLSYLVLLIIIVAVAATTIGITMAKKKNAEAVGAKENT